MGKRVEWVELLVEARLATAADQYVAEATPLAAMGSPSVVVASEEGAMVTEDRGVVAAEMAEVVPALKARGVQIEVMVAGKRAAMAVEMAEVVVASRALVEVVLALTALVEVVLALKAVGVQVEAMVEVGMVTRARVVARVVVLVVATHLVAMVEAPLAGAMEMASAHTARAVGAVGATSVRERSPSPQICCDTRQSRIPAPHTQVRCSHGTDSVAWRLLRQESRSSLP